MRMSKNITTIRGPIKAIKLLKNFKFNFKMVTIDIPMRQGLEIKSLRKGDLEATLMASTTAGLVLPTSVQTRSNSTLA